MGWCAGQAVLPQVCAGQVAGRGPAAPRCILGLPLLHCETHPGKHLCQLRVGAPFQHDKIPHLFPLISVFKGLISARHQKIPEKDDRGDGGQSCAACRLLCFFFNSVSWILTDFLMHTPLILN